MKYDDASWHSGGNFPTELPSTAGATHAGMFVAWAFLNGLAGPGFTEELPGFLDPLQGHTQTPGEYFLGFCDGKFTDSDLNELGNSFTLDYFDFDAGEYLADYESVAGAGCESLYHIPDTWDTFDLVSPVLDQRYADWLKRKSGPRDVG